MTTKEINQKLIAATFLYFAKRAEELPEDAGKVSALALEFAESFDWLKSASEQEKLNILSRMPLENVFEFTNLPGQSQSAFH